MHPQMLAFQVSGSRFLVPVVPSSKFQWFRVHGSLFKRFGVAMPSGEPTSESSNREQLN